MQQLQQRWALGARPPFGGPAHRLRRCSSLVTKCQQQQPKQQGEGEPSSSGGPGPAPTRRFKTSFVWAPPRADPPLPRSRQPCRRCDSTRAVECEECSGSGRLPRGGYHKRNPVSIARIIDSKWTAMERTFGWRHFRVQQKRKEGKDTFVLMVSTCDPDTQFWLNVRNLKERERWAAGWLQKAEIVAVEVLAGAGAECKACGGTGRLPCPLCSATGGEVVEL